LQHVSLIISGWEISNISKFPFCNRNFFYVLKTCNVALKRYPSAMDIRVYFEIRCELWEEKRKVKG